MENNFAMLLHATGVSAKLPKDILSSILENIDEALITTDAHGKILFFSEGAINLSQQILGIPFRTHDNIIQLLKICDEVSSENFSDIKTKKKSFSEFTDRNGAVIYLELTYVPVENDEHKVTHIHVFIRDFTQQKVFEKRLTGQAESIGNLIDKANAIIIGVDTRGYVTEWNDYCQKITGYSKDEVFAQKLSKVLLPKHDSTFDEMLEQILLKGSINNCEVTVKVKSNEKSIFLLSGTHRISYANEITGAIFVGQDITELTEYRNELEKKVDERTKELQKALLKEKEVLDMKGRFISIASHEFRTPISSIEYAAKYLKEHRGFFEPRENSRKIENIEKQVKHMMSLLDDVLTYSKGEAGKIKLKVSTIQLNDFFAKIIEDVSQSTKFTHVIETNIEGLDFEFTTDEKLLRNVFSNLLTNAIKFSPGQDRVFVNVVRTPLYLLISVRDKGIGIPEEEVTKIFEPFIRGKGVDSIQGTGLGLSIVKKAVELLNGTISATSKPGFGTTFSLKIPLHEN